jgi:hypothetical protein
LRGSGRAPQKASYFSAWKMKRHRQRHHHPQLFAKDHGEQSWGRLFLLVEGPLQNQDNVISVKAERPAAFLTRVETASHDFH